MAAQNHAGVIDYYAVLGVSADANFRAIQKAFYSLSRTGHPDKQDRSDFEEAHKRFVLLSAAYNVLKTQESRRQYDLRMRTSTTAQWSQFNEQNANKGGDDDFESQGPQSPGNTRFYADQSEQDAPPPQSPAFPACQRENRRQQETDTDPDASEHAGQDHSHESYDVPRHEDVEQFSPEEEAQLRFRTAKNNMQYLSINLRVALEEVLDRIRVLRKFSAMKVQAFIARDKLRIVEMSFDRIEMEMGSISIPELLTEATVIRVNKMVVLEGNVQDFLWSLDDEPILGPTSSEEEAARTGKLLFKAMNRWVQLCKISK